MPAKSGVACVLLMLVFVWACERSPAPPRATTATAPAAATMLSEQEQADLRAYLRETGQQTTAGLPPGHPPLDTLPPGTTPPSLGEFPAASAPTPLLRFTVPSEWREDPDRRTPLRFAQYRLPRAAGDTEDAELAILVGMGGGVEANLERWRKQFAAADGAELPDDAVCVEKFAVGELRVTLLDVTGRYRSDAMMLAGQAATGDNYRMLAAIVETSGSPWYFKLVGPAATVGEHRDRFLELLHSLHTE